MRHAEVEGHRRPVQGGARVRGYRHAARRPLQGCVQPQARAVWARPGRPARRSAVGAASREPAAPLSRSARSSVWPMRPVTPNIAIPVTRRRRLIDRAGEELLDPLEERCSRGLWPPSCSEASNRHSNSFCSPLKARPASRSPRGRTGRPAAPPRTGFTPFSRMRNTRPDCVSGGILQHHLAVERRHLDRTAERGGGEADRHLAG